MSNARKRGGETRQKSRNSETDASVRLAVERAAQHAGRALSEAVASARALLDAASIGVSGETAETHPHLSEIAQALDQLSEALSGEPTSLGSAALSALLAALDSEISRWEARSETDNDARAVLRAFLGLREFLWELGLRKKAAEGASAKTDARNSRKHTAARGPEQDDRDPEPKKTPRVQRITIQG